MFVSTTPQTLITDILAITDEETYGRITSSVLCTWINSELTTAWQWMRRCNRDVLTKVSAQFDVPSTGYISMTAAAPTGVGVTDWAQPRGLDCLVSSDWKKLKPWRFTTRDRVVRLSYRFEGETLYILPTDQATVYSYRAWYIYKAPTVSSGALDTALSIPDGLDEYVKQGCAAKVRIKLDDDPTPHLVKQASAMEEVKAMLGTSGGDQQVIADVADEYSPEWW